jgi:hypothetical protein
MAAYWANEKGEIADLMNKIPKLVFSKTLKSADWANTTLIKEDASAEIKKLKAVEICMFSAVQTFPRLL